MCPAGGVPEGFQLAMRSKSPYGPYEHKIVLQQGKTNINGPHQGGWVHTKYGEDWFLHFQDKEAYGRVVHLNPVDWSTGWPIMGKKGEPVLTYTKPKASSTTIVTNPQATYHSLEEGAVLAGVPQKVIKQLSVSLDYYLQSLAEKKHVALLKAQRDAIQSLKDEKEDFVNLFKLFAQFHRKLQKDSSPNITDCILTEDRHYSSGGRRGSHTIYKLSVYEDIPL